MRKSLSSSGLSEKSVSYMQRVGGQILAAIKKRGLKREDVAKMSMLSLPTLRSIINGDSSVGFGCYVSVLEVLGLEKDILSIADPKHDEVGNALSERNLPKRIKPMRSKYDF